MGDEMIKTTVSDLCSLVIDVPLRRRRNIAVLQLLYLLYIVTL